MPSTEQVSFDKSVLRDFKLHGLAASPGVAVGRALRLNESGRHQFYYVAVSSAQVRREIKRLRDAFAQARAQLLEIKLRLAQQLGYEHSYILDAHLMMLEDDRFQSEIRQEIRTRKINAEWAVRSVTDRVVAAYRQVQDAYLRERSTDIEDIAARLLAILSGENKFSLSELQEDVIVIADEVLPSTVAELNFNHVLGFATNAGGMTSHSAIIARALKIPAVVGLHEITHHARTGDAMVIDGIAGEVILRPTRPVIREYIEKIEQNAKLQRVITNTRIEPTVTQDGTRIILRANVELPSEVESLPLFGAEGIGLYRSEFMFLNRLPELPTEAEQFAVYAKLSEATGNAGARIRTFDLGGDKFTLPGMEDEDNPALGLRGIRLSLRIPDLFKTQLRAILRANARGNLRVVLPLITTLNEFREAKQLIENVKEELQQEGVAFNANLPIGVMIEVPAAAMMADMFAREADFLCVGTNDLLQYLLAVDRNNDQVADLFQPLHPALLRAIAHLVRVAATEGKTFELCGEMAANPLQAIALVGLGVRTMSMAPAAIPLIKNALQSIDATRLQSLMSEAMKRVTADEVEALLASELPQHAPFIQSSDSPN